MQYEGSSRADATKSLVHFACALGISDEVLHVWGGLRCTDLVVLLLLGPPNLSLLAYSLRLHDPITFHLGLTGVATRLPRPLVNKQSRSLLEDLNLAHSLLNQHNKPPLHVQQSCRSFIHERLNDITVWVTPLSLTLSFNSWVDISKEEPSRRLVLVVRSNTMDLSMDDASVFDDFDESDNFEPVPIVSLPLRGSTERVSVLLLQLR